MTGTYRQASTIEGLRNRDGFNSSGAGWVIPLLLSVVTLGAGHSSASAQLLNPSGNSVTYTIPFQPAYGSVVYSSPSPGSVTFGAGTTRVQVGTLSQTVYPGYPTYSYPGYPAYPAGTVLIPSGRPIRNVNDSVLVNPTIINGTIRNSTLVNPTIVTSPTYSAPSQPLPARFPIPTPPMGRTTINFPPIQYYPSTPSTIIIQTNQH